MSGQFIQGNSCLHTDEYAKYSTGELHIDVTKNKDTNTEIELNKLSKIWIKLFRKNVLSCSL